ncbi:MAG: PH domain-containing protein [Verrucomicrobiota bacterium]|jgi:hypothetical protein
MKHYKAYWATSLVVMSTLLTALFLGLAFVSFKHGGTSSWVGLLLLALVVGCALFAIRGYTVTPDAILVHRLLWATRLPLAGLQSAQVETLPWLVIRIGNGGFFSCTGWRYSPSLGFYRVFVTCRQAVVLRYLNRNRTVAVSPATPEEFVRELAIPPHVG